MVEGGFPGSEIVPPLTYGCSYSHCSPRENTRRYTGRLDISFQHPLRRRRRYGVPSSWGVSEPYSVFFVNRLVNFRRYYWHGYKRLRLDNSIVGNFQIIDHISGGMSHPAFTYKKGYQVRATSTIYICAWVCGYDPKLSYIKPIPQPNQFISGVPGARIHHHQQV